MADSKSEYVYYNNQIFKVPVVAFSLDFHNKPPTRIEQPESKVQVLEWDYTKYNPSTSSYLQNHKKQTSEDKLIHTTHTINEVKLFKTPTKPQQLAELNVDNQTQNRGRTSKKQETTSRSRSAPSNNQRSKSADKKPTKHGVQSPGLTKKRAVNQNTTKPMTSSATPKRTPSTPIFIKSNLAPHNTSAPQESPFKRQPPPANTSSPYFTGTSLTSEQLLASIDATIYARDGAVKNKSSSDGNKSNTLLFIPVK
jgi:hypothetical protein